MRRGVRGGYRASPPAPTSARIVTTGDTPRDGPKVTNLGAAPGGGPHLCRRTAGKPVTGGPDGPDEGVRCPYDRHGTAGTLGSMDRPAPHPPGAPRRPLLLVCDDASSGEALRSHLSRHGFVVSVATSARAAARAAQEARPDVVVIDAAVHGGWQAVLLALEGIPPCRVALLAAYWSADARRAASEAAVGAVLLKQIEGDALVRRLSELCSAEKAGARVEVRSHPPRPMAAHGGAR